MFAAKLGQLVGILTGGRNSNRAGSVVVEEAKLEGHLLVDVGREAGLVVDDVVVGWRHGAVPGTLANQIEVVAPLPLWLMTEPGSGLTKVVLFQW